MGKPRMILLIRHAQSEGNVNREIHQVVPDHRVKLTEEGWKQAEEAGERLRSLLRPDDTIQFFTSPYRRTRETTEGILRTLTSPDKDGSPSPFSRHSMTVYEEPRLREQDFGNFQPCSKEMERMWRERAEYGHFLYRIPNGESAADAYDRISGFGETLWRQFNEPDFPSVCVLVTHGLMTRVFLMKWYHWSVEYFEDLRNIDHCEFVIMEKNQQNGKYDLKNKLRTWSELQQHKEEKEKQATGVRLTDLQRRNTLSMFLPSSPDVRSPRPILQAEADTVSSPTMTSDADGAGDEPKSNEHALPTYLLSGRDGGGVTPHDEHTSQDNYFGDKQTPVSLPPHRKPTVQDFKRWVSESGMGTGKRADALGDEPEDGDPEKEASISGEDLKVEETSVRSSVY